MFNKFNKYLLVSGKKQVVVLLSHEMKKCCSSPLEAEEGGKHQQRITFLNQQAYITCTQVSKKIWLRRSLACSMWFLINRGILGTCQETELMCPCSARASRMTRLIISQPAKRKEKPAQASLDKELKNRIDASQHLWKVDPVRQT